MENFATYKLTQTGPETQAILDQVNTNTADIAQLRALYEALTQSEPVIIQPSDTWPVANPQENVIYRVIDRVNTPPQSYSDYMWNGTAMVLMATYDNAIDNEPTPGSNNLVKSGGVAASIVFDISAYHATGSTLATYSNLAAALGTNGANVPAAVRKGGMSVKFVLTSDGKYVQWRYMGTSITNANFTNVDNWSFCGDNVYVENPKWIMIITDKDGKILCGIKTDGSIEWSVGVPTPIIEFVLTNIQSSTENKVDKVEGKSLIDENYAESTRTLESDDFIYVLLDKNNRILKGIDKQGKIFFYENTSFKILEVNGTKLQTDDIENGFVYLIKDKDGHVVFGIREDGTAVVYDLEILNTDSDKKDSPIELDIPAVYTLCNDIKRDANIPDRNYAQSIYLTHLIQEIGKKDNLTFENGIGEKYDFISPIKITDSSLTNPTAAWNTDGSTDQTLYEKSIGIKVVGDNYKEHTLTIKHRSALNTATKDVTPRILCIGDSITFGEGSILESSVAHNAQIYPYHTVCQKLFEMDNIDANSPIDDYKCIFLGWNKIERTFEYSGVSRTYATFNAGIRGITARQYYKPADDPYTTDGTRMFMDSNGYFSLEAFINRYRTLDDNGNKLSISDPNIGSEITSKNIDNYNVCTPTHVFVMLGANDKATFNIEQYAYIIDTIKTEYPDIIVGCGLSDLSGTLFPQYYENIMKASIMYNSEDAMSSHIYQIITMKKIIERFNNRENEKIYILPFMFVQPTTNSFWFRKVTDLNDGEDTLEPYGWGPFIHINGMAHSHLGYSLYSWVKYTIAKHLI